MKGHFKNRLRVDVMLKVFHFFYCVCTELKAVGKKSKRENAQQQEFTIQSQAFIEKYRVKAGIGYDPLNRTVVMHVLNAGAPEDAIKVRELENEGVDDLVDSFTTHGVKLPMPIIGVIWADPNNKLLDINNFQVDFSKPNPRYHMHIICGMHRSTALCTCHKMFPKKPLYTTYGVTLLVLPRTAANMQMLLFIGNSDNRKGEIFVKTSPWSVVLQYRRQLDHFNADTTLSPSERQNSFTNYKIKSAPEMKFEKNTLHTLSACASVHAAVFEKMRKIFKGEYVVNKELKGQKKPDGVTHFTSMSGIPPKKLCEWLDRVLDGNWLTSTFQKRCKIYTKTERVMGQILEHIQMIKPKAKFHNLDDVKKVYPAVGDPAWYDAVIKSCEDAAKAKLSTHAIKMIEDMIETKDSYDKSTKVCISSVCFFLFHCFMIVGYM